MNFSLAFSSLAFSHGFSSFILLLGIHHVLGKLFDRVRLTFLSRNLASLDLM